MEWIFKLRQINKVASAWWEAVNNNKLFAFHGNMGTGKTTFIHALCESKGVTDQVTSPTFSLINEYRFTENYKEQKIFHIDLYRIRNEEEAVRAGIEDCLFSGNICFVEWPDKAPGILPPETVQVYFETMDTETRKLKLLFPGQIL